MAKGKQIPEYDPTLKIDLRRKLSDEDKEEIMALKGYIPRLKVAQLYNCSEFAVYSIWSKEKLRETNRIWRLKNGISRNGTKQQQQQKEKRYRTKKRLQELGLM